MDYYLLISESNKLIEIKSFRVRGNAYYIVLFVNNSTLSNVDMDIWDFTGQHLYYARPFVADVTLALPDYVYFNKRI